MAPWLSLRRATIDDFAVILGLIDGAADWLRTQGTDQWAQPWPDRTGRDTRVLGHISSGRTWICWDCGTPAATITADPEADPYWPDLQREEPAVYVHRMVVSRTYAGLGLGAELLNWAGRTAWCEYGAFWLRASAWTTNRKLHDYYFRQGFTRCRRGVMDPEYPAAALFQRPAQHSPAAGSALVREPSATSYLSSAGARLLRATAWVAPSERSASSQTPTRTYQRASEQLNGSHGSSGNGMMSMAN
jgi:GNAT superfamily N-acetyltransferase